MTAEKKLLTPRQIAVVELMLLGHSSRDIAHLIHCSPKSVERHRYEIYRRLGVENLGSCALVALMDGIVNGAELRSRLVLKERRRV